MRPVIEVEDLSFAYPGRPVLRNVRFQVFAGERVGLAGANGSGKSTLLWCLAGLLPAQGVRIFGESPSRLAPGRLGFVFQNPEDQLFMPTVLEDLMLPLMQSGEAREAARERAAARLDQFGLSALAGEPASHLSPGERKRAALAQALARNPELLLLDEPTAELDGRSARMLGQALRNLAITQVIAGHDLRFLARVAERLIILGEGTVVFDGPLRSALRRRELLCRAGLI
ncbi:MAG: energy-coupling factor ABC transporter ATP-binding protein [Bryobacteraceae bacterium]|nr:energy-coupling factor ABC transporter ATP-binding protein [Bryobacteraceae bacterium]